MIGLGQIPTIGNARRVHEMRLFQEVSKVDQKEAEQGALHSSDVLLKSQKEGRDEPLIKAGLAKRFSQFWTGLKAKKQDNQKNPEEDCPIAKARAASTVGENAPIGWLTLDNLADRALEKLGFNQSDELIKSSKQNQATKKDSLSFLQPDPDDSDYMFNEEWFLSPCG